MRTKKSANGLENQCIDCQNLAVESDNETTV